MDISSIYIIYLVIAVFASCVSALFGMGAALILLAAGAYLFDPAEAIALATIIFTSNTIARSATMWKDIPWKMGIFMAVASIPFAYLGAEHMVHVPTELLRRMLGALILIHVFVTWRKFQVNTSGSYPTYGILSAIYGYLSGLLGSGNPVKAIFFHHMGLSKHAFVGLMAVTSIPANAVKLFSYHQSGLLESVPNFMPIALIAISIIVAIGGRMLLKKLPDAGFKVGLQVMLTLAALGLIFS